MISPLRKIEKCRSCAAPIVWAMTSTGGNMPVDAIAVEDGNVLLMPAVDHRFVAIVCSKEEAKVKSAERYKSHFATCPAAASFRKGPRKAKAKP